MHHEEVKWSQVCHSISDMYFNEYSLYEVSLFSGLSCVSNSIANWFAEECSSTKRGRVNQPIAIGRGREIQFSAVGMLVHAWHTSDTNRQLSGRRPRWACVPCKHTGCWEQFYKISFLIVKQKSTSNEARGTKDLWRSSNSRAVP